MVKITPDGQGGPGTVVGVNVALTGVLKDQNDIVVYGMVEGEIASDKTVTIGETAQVKGPIKGQIVTVAGTVRGSIEATEKLEIVNTGKVMGNITAKDLVIHSGAIFTGKSVMMGEETATPEPVAPSEPDEPEGKDDQKEPVTKKVEVTEEPGDLRPDEE